MFVRFLQTKIDADSAGGGSAVSMPPFWELEALIADGYQVDDALAVMARRRAGPEHAICSPAPLQQSPGTMRAVPLLPVFSPR